MRTLTRRHWLVAFVVVEIVSLSLTRALGRDLNWDLFNYHFYAGLSVFHDRLRQDFFPASIQTYLNPLAYGPFYWMVAHGFSSYAVAAMHAALHALNPLFLYAITLTVLPSSERHPRSVACAAAALGCASALFVAELGTTFMDLSTAVPVLVAVWLLSNDRGNSRSQWLAGALLGLAVGLKLTNIAYAVGGLSATVLLGSTARDARAAGSRLICAMMLGFLVSYGFWGWKLYVEFGSPSFPFFNGVFQAPEYASTSIRFDRFVPTTFGQWLEFPLHMVELRSWVYTEAIAADVRPLVTLAMAATALLVWCWLKAWHTPSPISGPDAVARRGFKFLLLFVAASVSVWMVTSANGRYGLPWLMLLGPVSTRLFYVALPVSVARAAVLLLLVGQSFHMFSVGSPRWNPQDWKPTWFEAGIPDQLARKPYLYLSMGSQTNSFVAGFVHPQSAFVNLIGQHSLSFDRPGGDRLRQMLHDHTGRVRMLGKSSSASPVLGPAERAYYDAILDRILMRVDTTDCLTVSTDGASSTSWAPIADELPSVSGVESASRRWLISCAVRSKALPDPRLEAERHTISPVFEAFASKCSHLFRPREALPEGDGRAWTAYYMETGVYLNVINGGISYHEERQPVDTYIGQLGDWRHAVERFDCARPRGGSREF